MTNGDPHNMTKRLQSSKNKVQETPDISPENKQLIQDFLSYLNSQDLSNARKTRHLQCIRVLAENIDYSFLDIDKKKVVDLVGKINNNEIKEQELSDSTLAEYRKTLIKFLGDFMEKMKHEYPDISEDFDGKQFTDFFSSTTPSSTPNPDRLPTPNTVRTLVKHATNNRDKAFIMTLWSTGGRIGEILGLQWKDLKFKTKNGEEIAQVHFRDTKTGDNRKVPVRAGVTYLKNWKQESMESGNPEGFVFHNLDNGNQLGYKGARKIISRASKKQGELLVESGKKLNFHAFRKARASFLAGQGMNQATLCEYMGWVQGSDQAAVYIALAESDKEDSIMDLAGLEAEREESLQDLLPVKCHSCRTLNPFEAENCSECGEVLTTSEMFEQIQIEEKTDQFMQEIITSNTDFNPDEIEDKAQEFVKKEFNLEDTD